MKRDDEFKNAVLDSVALRPGLLLGAAGKGLARQVLSKSEQAAQIGLHHFSPRTAPESEQGLEAVSQPRPLSPFEQAIEPVPIHDGGAGTTNSSEEREEQPLSAPRPHPPFSSEDIPTSVQYPHSTPALSTKTKEASLPPDTAKRKGGANEDVLAVLQFETLSHKRTKVLFLFIWGSLVVALGFLVWAVYHKIRPSTSRIGYNQSSDIRAIGGGVAMVAVMICWLRHAFGFLNTWRLKKVWRRRRLYFSTMAFTELSVQWISLCFLIAPNIVGLRSGCAVAASEINVTGGLWLGNLSCFNVILLLSLIQAHNTNSVKSAKAGRWLKSELPEVQPASDDSDPLIFRDESIIWDLPIRFHAPKLLIWLTNEAFVVAAYLCLRYQDRTKQLGSLTAVQTNGLNCVTLDLEYCKISDSTMVLVSMAILVTIIYFILYCFYIVRRFLELRQLPHQMHKVNNLFVRMQLLARMPAFAFYLIGTIVVWYIRPYSCTHYVETWQGLLAISISVSSTTIALSYLAWPVNDKEDTWMMNVWLQEFAWLEEDLAYCQQRRNLRGSQKSIALLESEPMFCVQTAATALYWALLVYDVREISGTELSVSEACDLVSPSLTLTEVLWEKTTDTKLLLGWNATTIVLAFRGTASMSNVVADLQAWQALHIPVRGGIFTKPKVHAGFQRSYRAKGFSAQMLERVGDILAKSGRAGQQVSILVTGHSLGGALATLAAYDIARLGKEQGVDILLTCITFGAPRTGNHSFVKDFDRHVSKCWNIINDQDVITRRSKLVSMYKFGGHRVLINMKGDLIVRTTTIESSIRMIPCSGSVKSHMLTAYVRSFLMVLLGQFCSKSIVGGGSGAARLACQNPPLQRWLKQQSGLDINDLLSLQAQRSNLGQQSPRPALPTVTSRKIGRFLSQGFPQDNAGEEGGLGLLSQGCLDCMGDPSMSCQGSTERDCLGCSWSQPCSCKESCPGCHWSCSDSCTRFPWFSPQAESPADVNVSGLSASGPSVIVPPGGLQA